MSCAFVKQGWVNRWGGTWMSRCTQSQNSDFREVDWPVSWGIWLDKKISKHRWSLLGVHWRAHGEEQEAFCIHAAEQRCACSELWPSVEAIVGWSKEAAMQAVASKWVISYNLLKNWVFWGDNPFSNHLPSLWDVQVDRNYPMNTLFWWYFFKVHIPRIFFPRTGQLCRPQWTRCVQRWV